jgi:hypothetical protein
MAFEINCHALTNRVCRDEGCTLHPFMSATVIVQ